MTHREIAERLSGLLGRAITAVEVPPPDGAPPEVIKMFDYMDAYGLPASTGQLRALIGEPTPIDITLGSLLDRSQATT